jgi:hypothetical protein
MLNSNTGCLLTNGIYREEKIMLPRRFMLFVIALVGLFLPGFGMRAEADFGVVSNRPLSDPRSATLDERPVGTWRATIQEKIYYLHVGVGNIVGQSNWMELVMVNEGEKPTFYLRHLTGFFSTLEEASFFNVANMSKELPQLRGSTTEELVLSVASYEIFKYEVTEDYLDVWPADQKLIREAIETGKIKGNGATIDDTAENLRRFVESSAAKLFTANVRFTRVK